MIYLASASPRRKTLLEKEGYEITVVKSSYEELNLPGQAPHELAMEQALGKALETDQCYRENGVVIGSDTIVVLDNEILGKPKDEEHAAQMLRKLSGRTHDVISAVAIIKDDMEDVFFITTKIDFYEVNEAMIEKYIETGSPMDKAGAYGLQDLGDQWLKSVNGSISNVIGLPMEAVNLRLNSLGIYPTKENI